MGGLQPWHWLIVLAVLVAVGVLVVVLLTKSSSPPRDSQAAQNPPAMPAGWYPDQQNPRLMRYHDGRTWTSATYPLP